MLRFALIGVLALPLAGCLTAEMMANQDDSTCRSWGVTAGTQDYATCRAWLYQQHADSLAQSRANAAVLSGALLSR